MYRYGRLKNFRKPSKECTCGHETECHWTKEGHCVYQKCDCKEFKPKGRAEFANVKRGTCTLGHSHDSGLEVRTCFELSNLKKAGQIRDFAFHRVLDLIGPSGEKIATYEIDFVVETNDGCTEFIECKGSHLVREMGWRLKWSLLRDKHKDDPKYQFRVITD